MKIALITEVYDKFGNTLVKETLGDFVEIQTASRLASVVEWYNLRYNDIYLITFKSLTYVPGTKTVDTSIIAKYENDQIWTSYYYVKYIQDKFNHTLKDIVYMYRPTGVE